MSVVSKEELLTRLRERLEDITDDLSLSLIEDITDTIDDLETKLNESGDWKNKYNELDNEWRKKYSERFYNKVDEVDEVGEADEVGEVGEVKMKYEDLFESKEEKEIG